MKQEDLEFLYEYIKDAVAEYLSLKSDDEKRELLASTFVDRHMQTIDGQQPLPQGVFRQYLEEVQFVSDHEYIDEKVAKALTAFANLILTRIDEFMPMCAHDVDAMFDGEPVKPIPTKAWIDDDDNLHIIGHIVGNVLILHGKTENNSLTI